MADIDQAKNSTCSFEAAQLHVGERVQLEMTADPSHTHYYTTLIGFVPGHSVLVRAPLAQNLPVPVPEGANVIMRAFSGRHAYTMESKVDRVCRSPYPYMHLAYPIEVQQTLVRGDLRVRVAIPGTASGADESPSDQIRPVVISDLSVSGAQLESERNLGEADEKFALAFRFVVQPNNYEVKLATSVQVQSMRKVKKGKSPTEVFSHGVRFSRLHATEALLLQSYIQQVLLSDRSRVV